ncbi:acyltransferase ChoActase/COT/CPT [Gonapodya prolifera JEL478]|uniref:Acyltransferase ChoActase/COT/CPT n=1 Tax=Gonapodya prolifera (strain JEL478) TaxID=1344416 RepID=A0A139ADD8_GONPJ|nr:acyltransferase ChoActase/COT/CPT [Gonapodya prolifera JEL478]|eukprot:KXS14832.1 acyltransferase ChoActase/COT/CPT [Gonapodya prolifera JEL478]
MQTSTLRLLPALGRLSPPTAIRRFASAAPAPSAKPTAEVKTFANQSKLEKLPIAPFTPTIEKLLGTLKPLARTEEEWKAANAAVEEFLAPGGPGEHLDKRLREYGARQQNNWLEELWLRKAYLDYRETSVINVSYFVAFAFDPAFYPKVYFQIKRAAGWTSLLLDYKNMVDTETLPPEYADRAKTQPFCMDQYRKFFGATRVPSTPADKVITPHPATAKNIIVLVKDQIYSVDVLGQKGERVPVSEIERLLHKCIDHATTAPPQPPIARLSADHRDAYYTAYTHLASLSPGNRKNLDVMEAALFVVALDDYAGGSEAEWAGRSRQILHGGPRCANRWIDKELQLVAANDGRGGLMGEHTPADGASANTIVGYVVANEPARDPSSAQPLTLPEPVRLEWTVDDKVARDIWKAEASVTHLVNDLELEYVMWKDAVAGRWIKDSVSPDAFMQMIFQLAWARLYPHPTATYESASTRRYLHGRTETCRTLSVDSEAFARGFDKAGVSPKEKVELLRKACDAHVKYLKEASAGHGVDRYMLGLKCMLPESRYASNPPTLFSDPLVVRSTDFRLSTSNLSVSHNTIAGFGPVVMNGYGLNYNVQDKWMGTSVSARRQADDTSAVRLAEAVRSAVHDVKKAVDAASA